MLQRPSHLQASFATAPPRWRACECAHHGARAPFPTGKLRRRASPDAGARASHARAAPQPRLACGARAVEECPPRRWAVEECQPPEGCKLIISSISSISSISISIIIIISSSSSSGSGLGGGGCGGRGRHALPPWMAEGSVCVAVTPMVRAAAAQHGALHGAQRGARCMYRWGRRCRQWQCRRERLRWERHRGRGSLHHAQQGAQYGAHHGRRRTLLGFWASRVRIPAAGGLARQPPRRTHGIRPSQHAPRTTA